VLYGQVEYFLLTPTKIVPMAAVLASLLVLLVLFYRHLVISTFDPQLARSMQIPATAIHYTLMAALSLTTVASFEAVGAILAVALLVTPGATARLWTDRMPRMLLLAAAHAGLSTAIGYWLSHPAVLNTSASGAMCVAGFGLFVVSWLVAPRRGLVSQWQVRRQLRRRMAVENLVKAVHELTTGKATVLDEIAGQPKAAPAAVAEQGVRELLQVPASRFAHAVRQAVARGWATLQGGQLALTPVGHHRADTLARAHELWEQYLQKEVGLPADHLHDPAEWVEHYLSEERIEELKKTLT